LPPMSQRRALGSLFLVLALGFAGIGYASAGAGRWAIAAAAVALGGWMLTMSLRLLRRS
jgi:heme O synthase-like polyprenyltransferase